MYVLHADAKATLMMDAWHTDVHTPTFECEFYSGGKAQCGAKVQGSTGMRMTVAASNLLEEEALAHAHECLHKCQRAKDSYMKRMSNTPQSQDGTSRELAVTAAHDVAASFPLVLAHKNAVHRVPRSLSESSQQQQHSHVPQASQGPAAHASTGVASTGVSILSVSDATTLRSVCSDGRSRASTITSCVSSDTSMQVFPRGHTGLYPGMMSANHLHLAPQVPSSQGRREDAHKSNGHEQHMCASSKNNRERDGENRQQQSMHMQHGAEQNASRAQGPCHSELVRPSVT
jgi:hypothetical protein